MAPPPAKTPASQFLGKEAEVQILGLLIDTLRLASQPSCTRHLPLCAAALDVALVMIIGDGKEETNLEDARRRHPAFVSALFDFAFAPRSEGQLAALEPKMRGCRCNLRDETVKSLHLEIQGWGILQPWRGFIDVSTWIFRPIHHYIASTPPGQLEDYLSRKQQTSTRELDPLMKKALAKDRGLDRVVHYLLLDANQTISACQTWFKLTRDAWIVGFLANCLSHYQDSFHPPFLKCQEFLGLIALEFRLAVEKMGEENECSRDMFKLLGHYVFFLRSLELFVYQDLTPTIDTFAASFYETFLLFINIVANPSFTRFEFQEAMPKMFASTARMMYDYIPVEVRPILDSRVRALSRTDPVRNLSMPYSSVCIAMVTYQRTLECMNPECGKIPSALNQPFARCGGCGIVAYCSRECQKYSWTLPYCPHKRLCKTWATLYQIWKPELSVAYGISVAYSSSTPAWSGISLSPFDLLEAAEKHGLSMTFPPEEANPLPDPPGPDIQTEKEKMTSPAAASTYVFHTSEELYHIDRWNFKLQDICERYQNGWSLNLNDPIPGREHIMADASDEPEITFPRHIELVPFRPVISPNGRVTYNKEAAARKKKRSVASTASLRQPTDRETFNWNIEPGVELGESQMLDIYSEMQKLGRARTKRTGDSYLLTPGPPPGVVWNGFVVPDDKKKNTPRIETPSNDTNGAQSAEETPSPENKPAPEDNSEDITAEGEDVVPNGNVSSREDPVELGFSSLAI